ncbi:glycosyltransferase [Robertmurraya kyonggiensis]|nr:glycosyltransferase [Robertmurraya kyonggiensis]
MIVKNAETTINKCLESVQGIVDEMVIVDTGSTDQTISVIKKYSNVLLYDFNWCDDFSKARNYAIEQTTGDYILVLDSDEYITSGTRVELESVMSQNKIGRILICSDFKKENQIYQAKEYVSRFFPRETRFIGAIHEQLDSNKPRVKLDLMVNHSGYFETNKSKRNIPILLNEVMQNPTDPYYLFQLGKVLRIEKQYERAFQLLRKSYDLVPKNAPYYEELVVEVINCGKECGKEEVLEVIMQNDEILINVSDFHFAKGLYYLDYCLVFSDKAVNYIQKIEDSFLTCLRLNNQTHIEYLQGSSTFLPAYNLGVYYEVTSNVEKALYYYQLSSKYGYCLAEKRLEKLFI